MKKPNDFYICSHCYTVVDRDSEGCCDIDKYENGIEPIYFNWGKYLFLDPSLPLIPEEGKKYPLPENIKISRNRVITAIATCEEDLESFFSQKSKIIKNCLSLM